VKERDKNILTAVAVVGVIGGAYLYWKRQTGSSLIEDVEEWIRDAGAPSSESAKQTDEAFRWPWGPRYTEEEKAQAAVYVQDWDRKQPEEQAAASTTWATQKLADLVTGRPLYYVHETKPPVATSDVIRVSREKTALNEAAVTQLIRQPSSSPEEQAAKYKLNILFGQTKYSGML